MLAEREAVRRRSRVVLWTPSAPMRMLPWWVLPSVQVMVMPVGVGVMDERVLEVRILEAAEGGRPVCRAETTSARWMVVAP